MSDNNWPAWYYGPDGASDIFQNADEVPNGWKDHPSKVRGTGPIDDDDDDDDDGGQDDGEITAEKVAEVFSQDALIKMIDEANENCDEGDEIEYLGNWSKVKLAQALIDAEVEIEMPEGEEE